MTRGGSVRASRPGAFSRLGLLALAAAYFAANVAFVWKYGTRAGVSQALALPAFAAGVAALFALGPRLARAVARRDPAGRFYAAVTLAVAAALAAMMSRFDPSLIRVTRAPAIHEWIERLLRGEYPYASAELPSSFPVAFALAFPFDRIGDVGLLEITAFVVFAWCCWRGARGAPERAWFGMALLVCSPLFLYEIATRSELFANMTVLIALLAALERHPLPLNTVGLGVLGGLVLSTRGVVGLAYAVFLPWRFRHEPARGAAFAAVAAATFVVTWLPFAVWDPDRFARFGPFAIQMSYIPTPALALCGVVAVALGLRGGHARAAYARTGVLMLGIIAALFAHAVWREGWSTVLLDDHFDISYFAFGQTLLLYSVARGAWRGDEMRPASARDAPIRAFVTPESGAATPGSGR